MERQEIQHILFSSLWYSMFYFECKR